MLSTGKQGSSDSLLVTDNTYPYLKDFDGSLRDLHLIRTQPVISNLHANGGDKMT